MNKYFTLSIIVIIAAIFAYKANLENEKKQELKKRLEEEDRLEEERFVDNGKPVLKILKGSGNCVSRFLPEKYNIKYTHKDYDLVLASSIKKADIQNIDKKAIKIFCTGEAYMPNLDDYDLVIGFDRIDHPKYHRYPYYYYNYEEKITVDNLSRKKQEKCKPKKEHFACFLVRNNNHKFYKKDGIIARNNIFEKLSEYKHVASGGKHLNNIGYLVPNTETLEWISNCKFMIAYENKNHDGYITEKPFQAYLGGAIPIYWGSKTGVADINKDAIIYANDFESEEALIEYIKKVDNDDELYCKIWNQPLLTDPELDYEKARDRLRKKLFEVIDAKLPNLNK